MVTIKIIFEGVCFLILVNNLWCKKLEKLHFWLIVILLNVITDAMTSDTALKVVLECIEKITDFSQISVVLLLFLQHLMFARYSMLTRFSN